MCSSEHTGIDGYFFQMPSVQQNITRDTKKQTTWPI